MKKVFAALAASAVAVSMLAFAGCGNKGNKLPDGAIPGDYQDASQEQLGDVLDDILGNLFGDGEEGDGDSTVVPNTYNYGLSVNLTESANIADLQTSNASINADFKLKTTDDGIIGAGTAKVSSSSSTSSDKYSDNSQVKFEGTAYLKDLVIYGIGSGSSSGKEEYDGEVLDEYNNEFTNKKAKVNLAEIIANFGGSADQGSSAVREEVTDSSSGFDIIGNIQNYLTAENLYNLAETYSVSIGLDTKDGIKIKLSASEDTVWKIVAEVAGDSLSESDLATYKSGVKFNNFLFDVYLSLDSTGVLNGASVVVDISAKVDASLIMGSDGNEGGYEATSAAPEQSTPKADISVKGSVKLYTHNDNVTVPDGLADDENYWDATDYVLGMINDDDDEYYGDYVS